jgi:hypothetical protein
MAGAVALTLGIAIQNFPETGHIHASPGRISRPVSGHGSRVVELAAPSSGSGGLHPPPACPVLPPSHDSVVVGDPESLGTVLKNGDRGLLAGFLIMWS